MKSISNLSFLLMAISLALSTATSAEALNHNQTLALFSNATFDGLNVKKNSNFSVYGAADGSLTLKKSSGKVKTAKWSVTETGEHCVQFKFRKKASCYEIHAKGDGHYHKVRNGRHTHTLNNFIAGNTL